MKKTVDITTVRECRANLARIAREHPEITDRETPREELAAQWESTLEEVFMSDKVAYTIEEVAELLSCHKDTIRRAIKAGKLIAGKLGKEYRISRIDLEAYYRAHGGGELFQSHEQETEPKE
jgi:excisionase family DNA binding protein